LKEKPLTVASICEFRAAKEKRDPEVQKACQGVKDLLDSQDNPDRKFQRGRQGHPVERF
jgi:hypothetical protein